MTTSAKGPRGRLAAAVLAGALALQGCTEAIVLGPDSMDASDPCNAFRMTIAEARDTDAQRQAQAAAMGAALGALAGLAVGGDADERRRNAILGGLGGGLAGFSSVYYRQKAERTADAGTLLSSVDADARAERGLLTRTGQAARSLRECRGRQIDDLVSGVRGGRIEAPAARAELRVLGARAAGDNRIISAAFDGIGQRVDAYVDASAAAGQVDRALITRHRAALTPAARQVRAATPQVARVAGQRDAERAADQRAREIVDAELAAAQALLG